MPQIVISSVDDCAATGVPQLSGLVADGAIETRAVVKDADRPLWAWVHEMKPGSSLRWDRPSFGHMLYVWKGSVTAADKVMEANSTVVVEHKGEVTLTAGAGGARLVHFHESPDAATNVGRAGGHVHCVGPSGIFKGKFQRGPQVFTLWADSTCPSCELWLSSVKNDEPRGNGQAHYHTEDEVIFVVDGTMKVGRRELKPGTALAIDKNTVYTFGIGDNGLTFINFRPTMPHGVTVHADRSHGEPRCERDTIMASEPIT